MFAEDYYLKRWIAPGATVVDIGANVGQFRLFSLEYLRAARVLSFEPVNAPSNFCREISPKMCGISRSEMTGKLRCT